MSLFGLDFLQLKNIQMLKWPILGQSALNLITPPLNLTGSEDDLSLKSRIHYSAFFALKV